MGFGATPLNVFGTGPSTQLHNQELSRYREEARKAKKDFALVKEESTRAKEKFARAIFRIMSLQEQMSSLMNIIEELRRN